MKAQRSNNGKPKFSLIALDCLEPCARVLEYGAKKYSRDNWKKGMPITEIVDSLLRHLSALQRGERIDPESGEGHIGHIQCNALFLGNKANAMDIEMELDSEDSAPVSFEEYDAFVHANKKFFPLCPHNNYGDPDA